MNSSKNIYVIAASIVVASIIIGGTILYVGHKNSSNNNLTADITDQLPQPPDTTQTSGKIDLSIEGYPFVGKEDAPITIIEITDFQCPYCQKFATEIFPELKEKYIDTGKVKFVFRDFPLPYHPDAQKAAEAALCYYKEKGTYEDIYAKLFENNDDLSVEKLKTYAKDLGANSKSFAECLDKGEYANIVKADFEEINQMIQSSSLENFGTPAFLVDGQLLIGAQSVSAFEELFTGESDNAETTITPTNETTK